MNRLFCFIIFLMLSAGAKAQFFKGGVIAGLNASQIAGDYLAGYDKLGLMGGAQASFPLKPDMRLAIEFLYSQRGSQTDIIPGQATNFARIHLAYLELPIIYQYEDWYIEEEDYYRMRFEGGFSYGRLFRVRTSEDPAFENIIDGFVPNDFSFLVGGAYSVGPHLAFNIRYTRSLNRLYSTGGSNQDQINFLLGYFLSFRTEYFF